jgi:hypothetical protein
MIWKHFQGIKSHEGSTFADVVAKLKLLLPYVWPKGQRGLQARVVACGNCTLSE